MGLGAPPVQSVGDGAPLVLLEHQPEVVEQFSLEADTVGAHARGKPQSEPAAAQVAGGEPSLHQGLAQAALREPRANHRWIAYRLSNGADKTKLKSRQHAALQQGARIMGLLDGKTGLVLNIANDRSIATHIASNCVQNGARCGFGFLPMDNIEKSQRRVKKAMEENGFGNAWLHPCDVGSDESIERFFAGAREQFGNIDFLVHCLAFARKSPGCGGATGYPESIRFINNTDVPTPIEDAVANMKVIEAVFQSAKTATWV